MQNFIYFAKQSYRACSNARNVTADVGSTCTGPKENRRPRGRYNFRITIKFHNKYFRKIPFVKITSSNIHFPLQAVSLNTRSSTNLQRSFLKSYKDILDPFTLTRFIVFSISWHTACRLCETSPFKKTWKVGLLLGRSSPTSRSSTAGNSHLYDETEPCLWNIALWEGDAPREDFFSGITSFFFSLWKDVCPSFSLEHSSRGTSPTSDVFSGSIPDLILLPSSFVFSLASQPAKLVTMTFDVFCWVCLLAFLLGLE